MVKAAGENAEQLPKFIRINTAVQNEGHIKNKSKLHTVAVLMSTYNGADYIGQQIACIAHQAGVGVALFIRDDGSDDETSTVVQDCLKEYSKNFIEVKFCQGNNVGYKDSFLELLNCACGYEYYAFSDQDDYWENDKLIQAVDALLMQNGVPALYASAVATTDEQLKPAGTNTFPHYRYSITAELVRHRLAGHTMVWNDALQKRLAAIKLRSCWSHDQYLTISAHLLGATLLLDDHSYVLHRRASSSFTTGNNGFWKRITYELKSIFNFKNRRKHIAIANEILELDSAHLSKNDRAFLEQCVEYKSSFKRRLSLAFSPNLTCGLWQGDLAARLSILLGRY